MEDGGGGGCKDIGVTCNPNQSWACNAFCTNDKKEVFPSCSNLKKKKEEEEEEEEEEVKKQRTRLDLFKKPALSSTESNKDKGMK